MTNYIAYFDGATVGASRGMMGAGALLEADGVRVAEVSRAYGAGTSNLAEWHGLVEALELGRRNGARRLVVRGDSQLVIYQATGRYRIKQAHFRPMARRARELVAAIGEVRFEWIRRDENREADRLSRIAIAEVSHTIRKETTL